MKKDVATLFLLAFVFMFSYGLNPKEAISQIRLNPTTFINDIQQGQLSIDSAADIIANNTSFDPTEALDFVNNLQRIEDVNAAGELLGEFLQGNISEALTQQLSELTNLGNIPNLAELERILTNPDIAQELQDMLVGRGMAAVNQALSNLTEILGGSEALASLATEVGAEAIAGILEQVAPEVVAALGGAEAVANALNTAAGGGGIAPSGVGAPVSGDDGAHSCCQCQRPISINHDRIRAHVTSEFEAYRFWFVNDMFKQNILPALQLMTNQLTSVLMMQVTAVGQFFDAKHQLETQRIFQTLTAEAHKDYHPSEGLCEFGTNIRSLASSERKSDFTHKALAARGMQRQLSNGGGVSQTGVLSDKESRIKNFIRDYCDPTDNGNGFNRFCSGTSSTAVRRNKDINYSQTIENKLTLNIDLSDTSTTDDEKDVMALSANLFAHDVLPTIAARELSSDSNDALLAANTYLDIRAIAAKRSVAQNSFGAITALKSSGAPGSAPYLYRLMVDLGVRNNELEELLGANPSYFAQMEVLTKNIYQNPDFYTNLYDKPVNVERKGAVLQAIALMQDRDTFDSLIRSEAALATLLETLLQKEHRRVSAKLTDMENDGPQFGGGASGGGGVGGGW